MKTILLHTALLASFLWLAPYQAFSARSANASSETKEVVVTIKPLYSLVVGVMGDSAKPRLLIKGAASPHHFHLKPSQVKAIQSAKIIFYIDDSFETFLKEVFTILPATIKKVPLAQQKGIELLIHRQEGAWVERHYKSHKNEGKASRKNKAHHHHHDHDHDQLDYNMHIWLAPNNAIAMVRAIVKALSALYPHNKDLYRANGKRLAQKLKRLDRRLRKALIGVQDKPFIVFHDAYQYFERAYGLRGLGAISFDPAQAPSPSRLKRLRASLREENVRCVLREPQFSARFVHVLIEGSQAKIGIFDPLGADITPNADLYFTLLRRLASQLRQCLQ